MLEKIFPLNRLKVSIISAPSIQCHFFCFHRDKQTKYNNNVTSILFIPVIVIVNRMLNIHLRSTGERFTIKTIHFDTKVRELKTILEIICGIPAHLQLLSYLDEGTLLDSQKLKYYDPVPNCTFELDVWFIYEPIVQAVVANNEAKVTGFFSNYFKIQSSLFELYCGKYIFQHQFLYRGCIRNNIIVITLSNSETLI